MYFVRTTAKSVSDKGIRDEVCVGEVRLAHDSEGGEESNPMADLNQVLGKVFVPLLKQQAEQEWKQDQAVKCNPEDAEFFFEKAESLQETLDDAVNNLRDKDVRLAIPRIIWSGRTIENKQKAFEITAATNPEAVNHFVEICESWCEQVESLLSNNNEEAVRANEKSSEGNNQGARSPSHGHL